MQQNYCLEEKLEIVRIEAYEQNAIAIPARRSNIRSIDASKLEISGSPVRVSLREESATSGSQRQKDSAGPYYTNSLSWQTDDTSDETLSLLTQLESSPHHYIIYMYGGIRRLLYNEDGFGNSQASVSMQDTENASVSISFQSRIPILAIRE